jgi:hypothetical protein
MKMVQKKPRRVNLGAGVLGTQHGACVVGVWVGVACFSSSWWQNVLRLAAGKWEMVVDGHLGLCCLCP